MERKRKIDNGRWNWKGRRQWKKILENGGGITREGGRTGKTGDDKMEKYIRRREG